MALRKYNIFNFNEYEEIGLDPDITPEDFVLELMSNPDFFLVSAKGTFYTGWSEFEKEYDEFFYYYDANEFGIPKNVEEIRQKFKTTLESLPSKLKAELIEQMFENLISNYESKKEQDIRNKLKELGIPDSNKISEIEPMLDLSSTNGIEKIIYLKHLGILDFLKTKEPFKNSTNLLATVISAITGIPQTTVQPYLNPIVSPGANQKNNPLNSTKKVEAIKQTLINLGFKPQE